MSLPKTNLLILHFFINFVSYYLSACVVLMTIYVVGLGM